MHKQKSYFMRLLETVRKQHWKPILMLMVLSPFLAEVLSGATPVFEFFTPNVLFTYPTFLYGIPVLIIRELAMRRRLGLIGLWCLGIVYGLYHEGLLAKTLFHPFITHIDIYSTYGLIENIRLPWTIVITIWHGLLSVVIPVLFIEYLFPQRANKQWLSLKATWVLAIICIAIAIMSFFTVDPAESLLSDLGAFAFIIVAALVLYFVADKLPRSPRIISDSRGSFSWRPFLWGALLYVLMMILPQLLAELHTPVLIFILYFAFLAIFGVRAISKHRETTREKVMLFALGSQTAQSLFFTIISALFGDILLALTSAIFATIFLTAVVRIKRKSRS